MNIKIVGNDAPTYGNIETLAPPTVESNDVFGDVYKRTIAETFGIENRQDMLKYADKIETLLDYAKNNAQGPELNDLIQTIQNLELRLGSPPISEKKISYVARYAFLLMEKDKVQHKINQLEANNV